MSINAVVALRAKVNTATETPSDAVITYARLRSEPEPFSEPPTITGSIGSTHGARVVNTPAMKAPKRASIRSPWR